MRRILQLVSCLSLAATIAPAILFYYDKMSLDTLKSNMLIATICWFFVASLWMGREETSPTEEEAPSAVL